MERSTGRQPSRDALLLQSAAGSSSSAPVQGRLATEGQFTAVDLGTLSGHKPSIVALVLVISYLTLGAVSFKFILQLTWPSALYFAVTTALTVGYGDIDAWNAMSNDTNVNDGVSYYPSDAALLFTMAYILGAIVVVGASLGLLLESALQGGDETSLRHRYPVTISSAICVITLGSPCGMLKTHHPVARAG